MDPTRYDAPIAAPPIANEFLSGLPRNRPLSMDERPVKGFDRSPDYSRRRGDDTPIQAYSLRDDYERNAEWFPTKTVRDWKTVDRNRDYPKNTESTRIKPKYKATQNHWGTKHRSDTAFDRSRG